MTALANGALTKALEPLAPWRPHPSHLAHRPRVPHVLTDRLVRKRSIGRFEGARAHPERIALLSLVLKLRQPARRLAKLMPRSQNLQRRSTLSSPPRRTMLKIRAFRPRRCGPLNLPVRIIRLWTCLRLVCQLHPVRSAESMLTCFTASNLSIRRKRGKSASKARSHYICSSERMVECTACESCMAPAL